MPSSSNNSIASYKRCAQFELMWTAVSSEPSNWRPGSAPCCSVWPQFGDATAVTTTAREHACHDIGPALQWPPPQCPLMWQLPDGTCYSAAAAWDPSGSASAGTWLRVRRGPAMCTSRPPCWSDCYTSAVTTRRNLPGAQGNQQTQGP